VACAGDVGGVESEGAAVDQHGGRRRPIRTRAKEAAVVQSDVNIALQVGNDAAAADVNVARVGEADIDSCCAVGAVADETEPLRPPVALAAKPRAPGNAGAAWTEGKGVKKTPKKLQIPNSKQTSNQKTLNLGL